MAGFPHFILSLRNENDWEEVLRRYQNPKDGQATHVTYGFMDEPEWGDLLTDAEMASFRPYDEAEKAAVRKAMAEYEAVCGIDFREVGHTDGHLRFGIYDIEGAGGWTYYPETSVNGDRLPISTPVMIHEGYDFSPTGYGYYVMLHEIGHALGLEHTFEGKYVLPAAEDNSDHSIMSYEVTFGGEFHLRTYDIITLQSIYGPAKLRMGATTYRFGNDKIISDGGGTDTISARHATGDVSLDLKGGTWNWIGAKSASILDDGQVWLGHFTKIEKAYGGSGDDRLFGNEIANTLRGGPGADALYGRDGDDLLVGDAGNDVLAGGSGKDRISGNDGMDTISGGFGTDVLTGGKGRDVFVFEKLGVMGGRASHDRITDFGRYDRIDLSSLDADLTRPGRQKAKFLGNEDGYQKANFLGNGVGNHVFKPGEAGTFYFDTRSHELVFEANGDGRADYAIILAGVSSVKDSYFLI